MAGVSAKRLHNLYTAWKRAKTDDERILALADGRKLAAASRPNPWLPVYKRYCENDKNTDRGGWEAMRRDFLAGTLTVPGVGNWIQAWQAENAFGIRIGEPVVPVPHFSSDERNGLLFGKAFDCRIGCAAMAEVMRQIADEDLNVDVVASLSSQEEVGERGAKAAVNRIRPDIAIVFEGCPADDTFTEPYAVQTALKHGPMLRFMDVSVIINPRYQRFALDLAEREGIAAQASVREGGGNDAAVIQALNGAPAIVLGVPVRYIHTPTCIASAFDYEETVRLALAIIRALDASLIRSF